MYQLQFQRLIRCVALMALVGGCTDPQAKASATSGAKTVGVEVSAGIVTPALAGVVDAAVPVWTQELSYPHATYIAPHFSRLALPEGARLVVRAPNSRNGHTYVSTSNRDQQQGQWGAHVRGDTAVVEIYSNTPLPPGAVSIDTFARGIEPLEVAVLPGPRAVCGADESRWAKCYQTSAPNIYQTSRAVARLLINGTLACTGWVVGSKDHVMTNAHCISRASSAANTTFEFMAEGDACTTQCGSFGACAGVIAADTSTLVAVNKELDYALVQLPTHVSEDYGYLQLREFGPELGERIFIPQHPAAWGKKISVHANGDVARITSLNEAPCFEGPGDIGYYADTRGGSSGAPVIAYDDHAVVALHHCADCPNRGVPIDAIIDDLGDRLPADAIFGGGCEPKVVADGGPDKLICVGERATLGTPALLGHTYRWLPGGQSTAQISVAPTETTTYTVIASTVCSSHRDTVVVAVDDGTYAGLSDDFETTAHAWKTSGLWHRVSRSTCAYPAYSSRDSAMYYGQNWECHYATGDRNRGNLTSPMIYGIQQDSTLRFKYLREVDYFPNQDYDQTAVVVSIDGGESWHDVWTKTANDDSGLDWEDSGNIPLGQFAGENIQIRFKFDTVDRYDNDFVGWIVDDVQVVRRSTCLQAQP